jgi:hypothetical protein
LQTNGVNGIIRNFTICTLRQITNVIKSRRTRHAGKPGKYKPLEPPSVDEMIILKRVVRRYGGRTDNWTYHSKWKALADAVMCLSPLP